MAPRPAVPIDRHQHPPDVGTACLPSLSRRAVRGAEPVADRLIVW